jgi:hypothetical protein
MWGQRVGAGGAAHRAGQTVIVLSPGPRPRHQGCVPVSATLSRRIVARPADYYVRRSEHAAPARRRPRTALTPGRQAPTRERQGVDVMGGRGVAYR